MGCRETGCKLPAVHCLPGDDVPVACEKHAPDGCQICLLVTRDCCARHQVVARIGWARVARNRVSRAGSVRR